MAWAFLIAPAMQSDLLVASGEIDVDPAFVGGGAGSSIELRRGEMIVRRSTIHSDAAVPAQRTEAERIEALAERLADHESWLPADAWAVGPTAAARYTPARFRLTMAIEEARPAGPYAALDVADVDWPLPGRLEEFGQAELEAVEGWSFRCGPLTQVEALAVQRALAAAPLRPEGENLDADLDWAASRKHLTVSLVPLPPDDTNSCAVVGNFPEPRIDPVVLLRVDIRPDVSVGRMPSLTVYRAGDRAPPGRRRAAASPGSTTDGLWAPLGSREGRPIVWRQWIRSARNLDLCRRLHQLFDQRFAVPKRPSFARPPTRPLQRTELRQSRSSRWPSTWPISMRGFPPAPGREMPGAARPYVAQRHHLLKVTVFKQPGVDYPPQPLSTVPTWFGRWPGRWRGSENWPMTNRWAPGPRHGAAC